MPRRKKREAILLSLEALHLLQFLRTKTRIRNHGDCGAALEELTQAGLITRQGRTVLITEKGREAGIKLNLT